MPLSSDYGRTMDITELPDRSRGNGKRLPFPDEFPRANAFHYHGSSNIDLDFEDMFRLVGYAGADRFGAIHNRGTGKIFLNDWRPSFFLELLPGEVFSFRATVDREGDRELVGVEVPRRRLIWDASAYTGITRPYYNWSFGGFDFRLRPFFGSNLAPRYRDADVFSFGTGTLAEGTVFNLANWVATPEVWIVSTGGDIEITAQITLEITGSGALADGHSAPPGTAPQRKPSDLCPYLAPTADWGRYQPTLYPDLPRLRSAQRPLRSHAALPSVKYR